MSQDLLAAKSRALENSFFRERDLGLLAYLRSQTDQTRNQLAEISKIHDIKVLDELIRVGITAESFTALSLLPLVRIAWADAEMQDSERAAILQAAETEGISKDSTNYQLLKGWLDDRPDPTLLEAWREYAVELAKELDDASLAEVRRITMDRARRIAELTGGILGLSNEISKEEERALIDLARAFDKPNSPD
jgi:uncharacterized membrane protein YebE (DUF533 family)